MAHVLWLLVCILSEVTTGTNGKTLVELAATPTSLYSNVSFSQDGIFSLPAIDVAQSLTLHFACDVAPALGVLTSVLQFSASDASSLQEACNSVQYQYIGCGDYVAKPQCLSTTAAKFRQLATGQGVLYLLFNLANMPSPVPAAPSSPAASSDKMLYLLFLLLLVPVILIAVGFLCWKRAERAPPLDEPASGPEEPPVASFAFFGAQCIPPLEINAPSWEPYRDLGMPFPNSFFQNPYIRFPQYGARQEFKPLQIPLPGSPKASPSPQAIPSDLMWADRDPHFRWVYDY